VIARGMIAETVHPTAGVVRSPSHPFRFAGVTDRPGAAAPALGADTDEVLRDVAGYSEERVAALRSRGVIA